VTLLDVESREWCCRANPIIIVYNRITHCSVNFLF
jgi:hypothetical protein